MLYQLKKLWDKYSSLVPIPVYTCEIGKIVLDKDMQTKLMQFLIGLNDTYDNVRNQILFLEPLAIVNKAYSMILRVEKQWTVRIAFPDQVENAVMMVNGSYG